MKHADYGSKISEVTGERYDADPTVDANQTARTGGIDPSGVAAGIDRTKRTAPRADCPDVGRNFERHRLG